VRIEAKVVDVTTGMTGEKWTLVGVLFTAIVGAVKIWKPRITGMIARDEAALAAAETERAARLSLLQHELSEKDARIKELELADRESIQISANLRATNKVAVSRITALQAELEEQAAAARKWQESLEGQLAKAVKRGDSKEKELGDLRVTAAQLQARLDALESGG
jgi:chromosome segregation ATPase